MDWFLYDNGLRHERINHHVINKIPIDQHAPRNTVQNLAMVPCTFCWMPGNDILRFR